MNTAEKPFVNYGTTEAQFTLKVDSQLADESATKAVIDIAQKLIEALDEVCALSVNVTWTLNQSSTNSTYRISVPATPTTPLEPEKLWDIPPAEVLDELLGKP